MDEKIVKFGRKLEAEASVNKDEPEKCLKKEVRLFLAGQLIGWNSVWKIWYSCNSDVKLVASADSSQESLIVPNRLCVHQLMPTH